MARKKVHRSTFAEIVAEVPDAGPPPVEVFSWTVPMPWITGEQGQQWHLRGDDFLEGRDLHRALGQDIQVFHFYLGKRTLLAPEDREAFWARATSAMAANAFSEFRGYEYENEQLGRCLVVYESC